MAKKYYYIHIYAYVNKKKKKNKTFPSNAAADHFAGVNKMPLRYGRRMGTPDPETRVNRHTGAPNPHPYP